MMKRLDMILVASSIVALFLIGVVLREFRDLFLPLGFAVLLSIMFQPLASHLRARRVPTAIALILVIIILAIVLFVTGVVLHASAGPLITDLPRYEPKLEAIFTRALDSVDGMVQQAGLQLEKVDASSVVGATRVTSQALSSALGTFATYLSKAGLVLLFMLFMLGERGSLATKLRFAYPEDVASRAIAAFENIATRVRSYLILKVLLGVAHGLVATLALWLLGLEHAVFWGILAFVLSFIPYVGSVFSIGLPFVYALLQFDELGRAFLVLAVLGAAFLVLGSVVSPQLIATRLNLSSVLVLSAAIFWGAVWGPWGVILSVPLTLTISVLFENIDTLRPLGLIMREHVDAAE